MLKSYPAIFHKEDDGRFWVEFPEFMVEHREIFLKNL